MTERQPPVEPEDDENPEFDRFEALTKKLLEAEPREAAEQETGDPADEPREG